jgi:ring-1,2-phenylacetyl-CoA epoxidase subunit PaaE
MLKFHPLRVAAVEPEAEDAVRIALEVPEDLRASFSARPGQHIVVRDVIDGEELRRTYSLTGAPGDRDLSIAVRRHSQGKMSRRLADQLRAGATLEVLPPNGSFGPREPQAGGTYVAFAAGCGITPVIAIVRSLLDASPSNRVQLFYANRSSSRAMLVEELMSLKDRYLGQLSLHFLMSREPQEIEMLNGRIDAAKVLELAGRFFDARGVREYFICGPGSMIDDVTAALRELDVEPTRVHGEHFTVASVDAPTQASAAGTRPATAPATRPAEAVTRVTVIMDGRQRAFEMRRGEETILEAAERAGLDLPFSCRGGVCSTCRTKLVRGEVEMQQNFALEAWELEEGFILACQSHAKTSELEINYDQR